MLKDETNLGRETQKSLISVVTCCTHELTSPSLVWSLDRHHWPPCWRRLLTWRQKWTPRALGRGARVSLSFVFALGSVIVYRELAHGEEGRPERKELIFLACLFTKRIRTRTLGEPRSQRPCLLAQSPGLDLSPIASFSARPTKANSHAALCLLYISP